MNMQVTEFSGDLFLGTYQVAMDATLDALPVTTASDVISSTGDASVTLDTTAAPIVSSAVTGNSMTTSSNSSARLVALDNVNVRIDLDSDGNGSVDETILTTWANLTN